MIIQEDILGDFGFRCVWDIEEGRSGMATCSAFKIIERDQNGIAAFENENGHYPPVLSTEDAECYLESTFKWDGCSNHNFSNIHMCETRHMVQHIKLLHYMHNRVKELIEIDLDDFPSLFLKNDNAAKPSIVTRP